MHQIRHALKLGLGVDSPEEIHMLTEDEQSARFAQSMHGNMTHKWVHRV